jgi:hypothetical protein
MLYLKVPAAFRANMLVCLNGGIPAMIRGYSTAVSPRLRFAFLEWAE